MDNATKNYLCYYCGKQFTTSTNLTRHIKVMHTREREDKPYIPGKYKCNMCGKDFQSLGALYCHKKTKHTQKPYKCDQCPATFTHHKLLIQHIQETHTHPDEKPYVCEICNKRFRRRSDLTNTDLYIAMKNRISVGCVTRPTSKKIHLVVTLKLRVTG
ncbi:ZFP92 protein, partial [Pseudoatta argentina]